MKNTRVNKIFCLILLCALFIKIQSVFATQTFQNNLLKADLYKSSLGGVKVTLYTNKPYNDSVVVNKKNDFEYVILLPETSNSLTAKPALAPVSEVIKNIDVRTQQYDNQVKGYTKITISTTRPVEITPQVQVLNPSNYQLTDKDYKELLAQMAKKKSLETKTAAKPIVKTPPLAPKELVKKEQKSTTKMPTIILGKNQKKPSYNLPVKTQNLASKTPIPVQKVQQPKTVSEPKTINRAKPIEQPKQVVVKAPIQQKNVAPTVEKTLPTPNVNQIATTQTEVQTPTQMQTPTQTQIQTPVTTEVSTPVPAPVQKVGRFHKYKTIVKNNLYTILGIMLAGFILLLLLVRKINRNPQKQKEIFTSHLEDKPLPVTDYTENINEDMSWKEKFQTYVEASAPAPAPPIDESVTPADIKQTQPYTAADELDDLFSTEIPKSNVIPEENIGQVEEQDNLTEMTFVEEELAEKGFTEGEELFEDEDILKYDLSQSEEDIGSGQIDELFGEDEEILVEGEKPFVFDYSEEPIYEELEPISNIVQQVEVAKSEFNIDDEKGFYLVDFEDTTALVGHIDEEIFVLKRFDKKINEPLQARLDEKKGNSTNYMTKVGSFRGLVEVTPKNMNLLIEL